MDGNRRFANKKDMGDNRGHLKGFETLLQILKYCMKCKVKIVTVYAFSLDNFNRTQEEIDYLMNLAILKFKEFKENDSFVMKNKIAIRIIGDRNKISKEIIDIIEELELLTKSHSTCQLNICFAYSSTWEIQNAMNECQDDISQFPQYMRISTPNLLVRTSGENRLSDFLLYQCSQGTKLQILKKCWPELNYYDFLKILMKF